MKLTKEQIEAIALREYPDIEEIVDLHDINYSIERWSSRQAFIKGMEMMQEMDDSKWTNHTVIDFVNWFLKLHKLPFNYELENMEIIWSFQRGDAPELWPKVEQALENAKQ